MCRHPKIWKIDFSWFIYQNVTCFNISMDLTLRMEILKTLYRLFEDRRDHRFILNTLLCLGHENVGYRSTTQEWHYKPKVWIINERYIVADDILVKTLRHYIYFFPNIIHVFILEMFQINDLDCHLLTTVWRSLVGANCVPDKTVRALSDRTFEIVTLWFDRPLRSWFRGLSLHYYNRFMKKNYYNL